MKIRKFKKTMSLTQTETATGNSIGNSLELGELLGGIGEGFSEFAPLIGQNPSITLTDEEILKEKLARMTPEERSEYKKFQDRIPDLLNSREGLYGKNDEYVRGVLERMSLTNPYAPDSKEALRWDLEHGNITPVNQNPVSTTTTSTSSSDWNENSWRGRSNGLGYSDFYPPAAAPAPAPSDPDPDPENSGDDEDKYCDDEDYWNGYDDFPDGENPDEIKVKFEGTEDGMNDTKFDSKTLLEDAFPTGVRSRFHWRKPYKSARDLFRKCRRRMGSTPNGQTTIPRSIIGAGVGALAIGGVASQIAGGGTLGTATSTTTTTATNPTTSTISPGQNPNIKPTTTTGKKPANINPVTTPGEGIDPVPLISNNPNDNIEYTWKSWRYNKTPHVDSMDTGDDSNIEKVENQIGLLGIGLVGLAAVVVSTMD